MAGGTTIINLRAARAARGLPVAPLADAPATYQVGQPVTVLGRPIRYGWVVYPATITMAALPTTRMSAWGDRRAGVARPEVTP
ncbi:hypothetical protein, partial [Caenispirillum bisanense]